MRDSLRARLLLWYALILAILIVSYGSVVAYLYWQSLIRDVDADLTAVASTVARSLDPDTSGELDLNLPPDFRELQFADGSLRSYYAVWDGRGQLVDRSDPSLTLPPYPPPGRFTRRGYRELVVEAPGPARILVGRTLLETDRDVEALALRVGATGLGVLLVSLVGGWFLVGRALAPIARISKAAGAMVSGNLTARIPVQNTHSELEQVATALNGAFDRLQLAADSQRVFTADASHELRTPLATLRAEFDWVLQRPRSDVEYRATIEKSAHAVERMTRIANGLLTLARGDHATIERRRELIDLNALIEDTIASLRPLATASGVHVHSELVAARVRGDASSLVDAFTNLIKNAVEYSHPGGIVDVRLWTSNAHVFVAVRDSGIGIAAADLPRIFDRFYRADKSRARRVGGAGLGLAIARKAFDDHQGVVTCVSTLGAGAEFTVQLPRASTPPAEAVPATDPLPQAAER